MEFSEHYPWRWTAAHMDEWSFSLTAEQGRAKSTIRTYQGAIRLFCDFITSPHYHWAAECEKRFGTHPVQICHEWNTATHLEEYEGDAERRPLTREECQALFDYADDRVEHAIKYGRKGALTAYRDATVFKTIYAWGLRCREVSRLDLTDFYRNPKAPELGRYGQLHVRYGKASKGSGPRRRMVGSARPPPVRPPPPATSPIPTGWARSVRSGPASSDMSRATAPAPRFMTEPQTVIIETIATLEPGLPTEVLASTADQSVDTRAKLRRLAQALEAAPDLLTSGRPEGPRLVELLIRALQAHGTKHLVLPGCARCGRQRPLPRVDGPRRICDSCAGTVKVHREPRAVCGKTRAVAMRDRDDRARCFRHPPEATDDTAVICGPLQSHGTGLDDDALTAIVERALPRAFQRREIAGDLTRRPELISGQGAHGSPRMITLIEALVEHGALGITLPACPFCERTIPLRFRRDDAGCCCRCYDKTRLQDCSRCGNGRNVVTRAADGQPLCGNCMKADPHFHEVCRSCGQLAFTIRHDDQGQGICDACWRPPVAICSVCGNHKPCHYANSEAPPVRELHRPAGSRALLVLRHHPRGLCPDRRWRGALPSLQPAPGTVQHLREPSIRVQPHA
ncbi:hypothetical protein [Streptomyces sp. NRRL S-237]|uniref:hypothetical protein n=1 Tax=Streptomyces sp. NRRL S-237 TaxID=1463895 RepID=UPI0006908A8A|nr:hypothetical protein [Streptomyces sp. NRRL S-237]